MSLSPPASPEVIPSRSVALETLYQRGEHYTLLNAALGRLETEPDNAALALLIARSYVALGLMGPAREILTDERSPLAAMAELEGLRAELSRAPSGRIAWSTLESRFAVNARRIYKRHPHLRSHDVAFRSIPGEMEVFLSADGNLHASFVSSRSMEGASAGRRWFPDLLNVKKTVSSTQLPHDHDALFCAPYAVARDRFGALFDLVYEGTRRFLLKFTPRIYLLEPDVRMLGLLLYTAESVDRLCEDRVGIFVGDDCAQQLGNDLRAQPSHGAGAFLMELPSPRPGLGKALKGVILSVEQERAQRGEAAIDRAGRHYAAHDPEYCHGRFRQGRTEPLRVLGLTSRFTTVLQYSMRDLQQAFEQLGHEFRIIMESSDHDLINPVGIAEDIAAFKPDLVFVIDHHRREYPKSIPAGVPFVCWVQDPLPNLVCEEAGRSLGSMDFYIAPAPEDLVFKYRYAASQGIASTMVTNARVYSAERLGHDELSPHRCDLSYVSNQSGLPRGFHEQCRRQFGNVPAARRLADYLFETLATETAQSGGAVRVRPATNRILEATRALGLNELDLKTLDKISRFYLHPLFELMFRQGTLEWVANYCDRTGRTLRLYGNGWELHPRFCQYACGVAQNGRELRAIYQASAINLQVISGGAIHQRLLDGLASGGFFLLRSCPVDNSHVPIRAINGAIRKYGVLPERDYRTADVPELAAALEALAELEGGGPAGDTFQLEAKRVANFQAQEAGGFRRFAGAVFDQYEDVAFDSGEAFSTMADRYLRDEPRRAALAGGMRATVLENFTYDALVSRLLAFMSDSFADRRNCRE